MRRALVTLLAAALVGAAPLARADDATRFASIAFHDVVDRAEELDGDGVTTARLVAFFDWLRAGGWTPVSLDAIAAAGRGERPLPPRAVLLTFDDGYRSLYTRVYPLALAYRVPIVAAVVGSWMDTPLDATVRYGDRDVPRRHFITWDEAREMQRSGLVEFASHSYDLHRGILANPQGNQLPAAAARAWDAASGYETAAQYRARIALDLQRSRDGIARELGRAPRALVWPFGRYTGTAQAVADALGYRYLLTLDPAPGDAAQPAAMGRYLPTRDPTLAVTVDNIRFEERLPAAQRYACVDARALWSPDPREADERLGRAIERLRAIGANAVVIDAFSRAADGRIDGAWFPNGALPLRGDYLSRLAWQLQTRAGADAYVRLPLADLAATLGDAARVDAVLADLGAYASFTGVLLDDPLPALADIPDRGGGETWAVARVRTALDAARLPPAERRALEAFRIVERARPGLKLALFTPGDALRASGIADMSFARAAATTPAAVDRVAAAFTTAQPMARPASRRVGLWFAGSEPPDAQALVAATQAFQVRGGTAVAWCPDDALRDAPDAAAAAPGVSAATFPLRP
jgi:peptidoglycan/xylan/chitin deacetylase (PgdA/CDA1 family)